MFLAIKIKEYNKFDNSIPITKALIKAGANLTTTNGLEQSLFHQIAQNSKGHLILEMPEVQQFLFGNTNEDTTQEDQDLTTSGDTEIDSGEII